ncbi:MAG: hypothetical protein AB7E27_04430 [Candidatus Methanomethylophilaceae archaeon]|jgi:hypothetical protein
MVTHICHYLETLRPAKKAQKVNWRRASKCSVFAPISGKHAKSCKSCQHSEALPPGWDEEDRN